MDPIRTETDIDVLRQAATAYGVISAWTDAGLWAFLADGAARRADEMPADRRAVEITAPVLAHLGLLMRVGDAWTLTPTGRSLVSQGTMDFGGAGEQLGSLSRLDAVMAEGGPVRDRDGHRVVTEGGVRESEPDDARRFMDRLYRRAEVDARELARWTSPRLPQAASILDLGGGHGRYSAELAALGHRPTILDRAVCIDVARQRYGDTLRYLVGDFQRDDLGGPWDGVILSNIVHGLGPDENLDLLRRLKASLRAGGLIVVKDMFLDDTFAQPGVGALFGIQMLLYTRLGQSYRVADFVAIARRAGFTTATEQHVSDRGYSLLFLG